MPETSRVCLTQFKKMFLKMLTNSKLKYKIQVTTYVTIPHVASQYRDEIVCTITRSHILETIGYRRRAFPQSAQISNPAIYNSGECAPRVRRNIYDYVSPGL